MDQNPYPDLHLPDRFSTGFYDQRARYYALFSDQLFSMTIPTFLLDLAQEVGCGSNSALDIACGPGQYTIDMARRGVQMTAVDLSSGMLDVARERAHKAGVQPTFEQGNMIDFRTAEPVDLAFTLGESMGYLQTSDEMLSHLDAVADSLNPGGLYVAQFTFPLYHWSTCRCEIRPPWVIFSELGEVATVVQAEVDGARVEIDFHGDTVWYDPIRQIFQSRFRVVTERDGQRELYEHTDTNRLYLPQELKSLVRLNGRFECLGLYYDFFEDARLEHRADAHCFIAVLRRN